MELNPNRLKPIEKAERKPNKIPKAFPNSRYRPLHLVSAILDYLLLWHALDNQNYLSWTYSYNYCWNNCCTNSPQIENKHPPYFEITDFHNDDIRGYALKAKRRKTLLSETQNKCASQCRQDLSHRDIRVHVYLCGPIFRQILHGFRHIIVLLRDRVRLTPISVIKYNWCGDNDSAVMVDHDVFIWLFSAIRADVILRQANRGRKNKWLARANSRQLARCSVDARF